MMTWVSPSSLVPDTVYYINGVAINKYLLKYHNVNNISLPANRTNKFKGVVIHNTDRVGAEDEGRQYTAATLNNNIASRTTFYVTELSAWQNLELTDMNWTCGDGTRGEGNNGCISLEIIMKSRDKDIDLKARDNGAKIAAYILWQNGMTVNDMYTHNYFLNVLNGVQGDYNYLCTTPTPTRNCPYYIVWDWEGFRKQVDAYIVKLGGKSVYNTPTDTGDLVNYIYQATSTAAIRPKMSKSSEIYGRVTKGNYYCADTVYPDESDPLWFKYAGQSAYSMLYDGGYLFKKVGNYTTKVTAARVNVREKPNFNGKVITTLPSNTLVYVWNTPTTKANGYTWCKIVYNGKTAYMVTAYFK